MISKILIGLFMIQPLLFAPKVEANSNYKVKKINAHFFYNQDKEFSDKKLSGTFSTENLIDNSNVHLFNSVIGEGSSLGYTDQTLLIIELNGLKENNNQKSTLKVIAKTNENTLLKVEEVLMPVLTNKIYKKAYILNDTGCKKVFITAQIWSQGKIESELKKEIPFVCGE